MVWSSWRWTWGWFLFEIQWLTTARKIGRHLLTERKWMWWEVECGIVWVVGMSIERTLQQWVVLTCQWFGKHGTVVWGGCGWRRIGYQLNRRIKWSTMIEQIKVAQVIEWQTRIGGCAVIWTVVGTMIRKIQRRVAPIVRRVVVIEQWTTQQVRGGGGWTRIGGKIMQKRESRREGVVAWHRAQAGRKTQWRWWRRRRRRRWIVWRWATLSSGCNQWRMCLLVLMTGRFRWVVMMVVIVIRCIRPLQELGICSGCSCSRSHCRLVVWLIVGMMVTSGVMCCIGSMSSTITHQQRCFRWMIVLVVGFLHAIVHSNGTTRTLTIPRASPINGTILAVAHLVVTVPFEEQGHTATLGGDVGTSRARFHWAE